MLCVHIPLLNLEGFYMERSNIHRKRALKNLKGEKSIMLPQKTKLMYNTIGASCFLGFTSQGRS